MRTEFLPYHLPSIGQGEIDAVIDTLRSGWLTTGPKVKRFEAAFAAAVGVPHAIAVNSRTAGIHLGLEAFGVGRDDEVIVPTFTFAATAEVVVYLSARPVLVDCQRDTYNVDPEAVESAVTSRTRGLIPVHFGGQACDMDEILEIARCHRLAVIEDAAHALPASYRGRPIGGIGEITCFSFYATKTLTTGEGGMVTTRDAAAADRMRSMGLHGISRDAWKRYMADGSWYYEILQPGFKYNLTDLAAGIGIEQLRRQDEFRQARAHIAERYTAAFASLEEVRLPTVLPDREHAWHLYVIEIDPTRLRINRNGFIIALREQGIGTSVHFIPLHLHPYYRDRFGFKPTDFPNALAAFERVLSLPIYPAMTDQDVDDVISAVGRLVEQERRCLIAMDGAPAPHEIAV